MKLKIHLSIFIIFISSCQPKYITTCRNVDDIIYIENIKTGYANLDIVEDVNFLGIKAQKDTCFLNPTFDISSQNRTSWAFVYCKDQFLYKNQKTNLKILMCAQMREFANVLNMIEQCEVRYQLIIYINRKKYVLKQNDLKNNEIIYAKFISEIKEVDVRNHISQYKDYILQGVFCEKAEFEAKDWNLTK